MREDNRPASQHLSGVSDSLSMVSTAYGNDAGLFGFIKVRQDFVESAANLECARGLEDFELQKEICTEHLAQCAAAHERRPLHVITDSLLRFLDVFERDHRENDREGVRVSQARIVA